MKVKALHGVTLVALLSFSSIASAAIFNWTAATGTNQTGSSALSGQFSYDSVSGLFSNVNLSYTEPTFSSTTAFSQLTTAGSLVESDVNNSLKLFFDPGTSILNNVNIPVVGNLGVNWYIQNTALNPVGQSQTQSTQFNVTAAVPEPSTYAMMVLGLLGVAGMKRRNKKQSITA